MNYLFGNPDLQGHFIPEGTIVNADIHYVMAHDPVFEHPHEFRPERYLTDDGKTLKKVDSSSKSDYAYYSEGGWVNDAFEELVERTLPFSLGKRVCAGEGMAKVELFLGLTATIQRYRLSARSGQTIDLESLPQNIKIPREQEIVIERV